MSEANAPLSVSILRGLSDKFYEKRKIAALDVERLSNPKFNVSHNGCRSVRECMAANDILKLRRIIDCLVHDFAYSVVNNSRNGGLIGLAAVGVGLGPEEIDGFLVDLVPPVLACLTDQDARVRYYACESMYNLCKVARIHSLRFFNDIFDALSKVKRI